MSSPLSNPSGRDHAIRDPLTIAGVLLVPADDGRVRPAPGSIVVRGERIEAVSLGELPARWDLGGPAVLVSPGFVDTHLHLPQFDSIGRDGMELLEWLEWVIFPAEVRWADADFAGQMAARVARQLLSFGTTTVAAYATVHHEAAQAAIHVLGDAGLRGWVGQVLMDRGAPPELVRPPARLIDEAARLHGHGRIIPAVTPRFAVSCSPELLAGAGDLARRTGAPVQTHLAENQRECALVREQFGAGSYTAVYDSAGLLTPRTILGHGIWLDPAERSTLAASGSIIAHCPTANLFLNSGSMDLASHRRAGVRLSLGSDIAGGPDRSMVRVARAMIETAKRLGHAAPTAAECFWQITEGNALAMGLEGGARLAPGSPADLVLIEPDISWAPDAEGLSTLLYAWDDRWLKAILAAGNTVSKS